MMDLEQTKSLFSEWKQTKEIQKKEKMKLKLQSSVVRIWVDLLRSGKFSQCFELIVDFDKEDSFCALGVASNAFDNNIPRYSGILTVFSDNLIEKIIKMNDEEKKSFEEIASFLEKTFLKKGAE